MKPKYTYEDTEIANFHIPRWNELPTIDLYLDQLVSLLDQYLSNYIIIDSDSKNDKNVENDKDGKIITKTMINNYVKHKVINPPNNKKYNREHIAFLFVVCILKQVYSINDIVKLIDLAINGTSTEKAYNRFCNELEMAIKVTFAGEEYPSKKLISKDIYILKNVVQSFADKLYVKRVYLDKK